MDPRPSILLCAREQVQQRLEKMMHSGQIQPGQKLRQAHLARELGVSQTLVREALLFMQAQGLVRGIYNRGMYASALDVQQIFEAYQIRLALETLAVELCCGRVGEAESASLRHMARRIHDLSADGRFDQAGELDRDFHLGLIRLSGNASLVRLTHSCRFLSKFVRAECHRRTVQEQHLAIVEAIARNDVASAREAIRRHLQVDRGLLERDLAEGVLVLQGHATGSRATSQADPARHNQGIGGVSTPHGARRQQTRTSP